MKGDSGANGSRGAVAWVQPEGSFPLATALGGHGGVGGGGGGTGGSEDGAASGGGATSSAAGGDPSGGCRPQGQCTGANGRTGGAGKPGRNSKAVSRGLWQGSDPANISGGGTGASSSSPATITLPGGTTYTLPADVSEGGTGGGRRGGACRRTPCDGAGGQWGKHGQPGFRKPRLEGRWQGTQGPGSPWRGSQDSCSTSPEKHIPAVRLLTDSQVPYLASELNRAFVLVVLVSS